MSELTQIFSDIFDYLWIFTIYVAWWLFPIIAAFWYKKKLTQYPIEAVIYEVRGENLVHQRDVCGRFEYPVTCYRLKNNKDTIPIPQYDWILNNISKPTNLFDKIAMLLCGKAGTITLLKYGSKQYKPIDVNMVDGMKRKFKEVKDKKGNPVWVTIYEPINVKESISKLDFEVIDWDDINHMTQEIRAIIQRRSPVKSFLEKYGPAIAFAAICFMFIFALYYSYELIISAGDRYINAAREIAGVTPPPKDVTPDLPLDDWIPKT